MKHPYPANPAFTEALNYHKRRLNANMYDLCVILECSERTIFQWLHGKAPKPVEQEGILARLEKERPLVFDLRSPDLRNRKQSRQLFF